MADIDPETKEVAQRCDCRLSQVEADAMPRAAWPGQYNVIDYTYLGFANFLDFVEFEDFVDFMNFMDFVDFVDVM